MRRNGFFDGVDVSQHRHDTLDLSHPDLKGKVALILALLDHMATHEAKLTKSNEAWRAPIGSDQQQQFYLMRRQRVRLVYGIKVTVAAFVAGGWLDIFTAHQSAHTTELPACSILGTAGLLNTM